MSNKTTGYEEDDTQDFGLIQRWPNAKIRESITTSRNTLLEIVERPQWGLACYMNNSIQSCTVDEKIYHEALVHPAMSFATTPPQRVCIIGGGEGATAREVLKFPGVVAVDMFEWDTDVVKLFMEKYPQWAKGAWNDSRIQIYYEDIFEAIQFAPIEAYDAVIIDLFEPQECDQAKWTELFYHLPQWCKKNASISIYAGMRNILKPSSVQPYTFLMDLIDCMDTWCSYSKLITPYRVWIPSFSGEATFLLLNPTNHREDPQFKNTVESHMNTRIWNSYKTFNW